MATPRREREEALARERDGAARRARDAYRTASAAEAAGDLAGAARWFERAHRLARNDETIAFALGLARLRAGDPAGAVAPLLPIARALDLRPAWVALALARLRQHLPEAAAHLLGEALARHALDGDKAFDDIADEIARAAGSAGWCGLTADGIVVVRALGFPIRIGLRSDGARIADGVAAPGAPFRAALGAGWERRLTATIDAAVPLLAPTLHPSLLAETDGLVEADGAGGLTGWASRRRAPGHAPVLSLRDANGRVLRTVRTELALEPVIPDRRFGTIARGFRVAPADCPPGPLELVDEGGRPLNGSPIEPALEWRAARARAGFGTAAEAARFAPVPASFVGPAPTAREQEPAPTRRRRSRVPPVAIVIPVYADRARTLGCLNAVFATVPADTAIHVVDDATPEPALATALAGLAASGRIALHRHPQGENRGFPASVALGIARAEPDADIVLLNSDTRPAGGWLARLRRAAYAAPDIASATPLTNDGSILAYPRPCAFNDMPDASAAERLAAIAAIVNDGIAIDIPTANGFCMFVRRVALATAGSFRTDLWGRGYGEENDWSMRCRHAGWRHVAVADAYVAHAGGVSFGAGRLALARRNGAVLERLHPGYDALVAAWIAADPLAPARRRLDAARLREAFADGAPVALFVTHASGGGVERFVRERFEAARARGERVLALRPDPDGVRTDLACLDDGSAGLRHGADGPYPNLRYALPAESDALTALLSGFAPVRIELHHLLGHHAVLPALLDRLGCPVEVWLHDYAAYCHQVGLFGPEDHYCGEPDRAGCRRCVAEIGSRVDPDHPDVDALLERSGAILDAARAVFAPSEAVRARFAAHFPSLATMVVTPWQNDPPAPAPSPRWPGPATRPLRVVVPGGLGPEKGLAVVLACARDASARALPLEFVVIGHSAEDDRLLALGVFVTGPYELDEADPLLRAAGADLAFVASRWPETWCYTLGECWAADLPIAVFDIGTQAERVRRRGGLLLPLDLDIATINDRLLAFARGDASGRLRVAAPGSTTTTERSRDRRLLRSGV